jgi:hypothetical protein
MEIAEEAGQVEIAVSEAQAVARLATAAIAEEIGSHALTGASVQVEAFEVNKT